MIAFAYYLLKVIICSGILFIYYHLALKNKIFHQWNRFYLLLAVVLSLSLPLLQFYIFDSRDNKAVQLIQVVQSADNYLAEFTIGASPSVSPEQWALGGYLSICVVLFLSLALSLLKIFSILRLHKVSLLQNIRFVLTKEPGTPFSFLNYIFWNDAISLQSQTGQQIFQHELVHVKEKHTHDKLFMQTVLILFWCNPLFWLIRRELKFIHEFIADKKAVGDHGTEAFAAMIMQTVYPQQYHSITNQFFQTSIKRRLLMLTKIQNPKRAYFSRIIALPLLAITVIIFSFRTKSTPTPEQINPQNSTIASQLPAIDLYALLSVANDTPPAKSKKEITTVDVRTRKEIAITYSDGTSEVLTEQEANNRGLINNGGFYNEKNTGQKQYPSSTIRLKPGATSPLYIVDEKEITAEEMSRMDTKMIESINVLKDKPAIDKYGLKGNNGVVEMKMKKAITNKPIEIHTDDGRTIKGNITNWNVREKEVTLEANIETVKPVNNFQPVYFVDGKEVAKSEMEVLDPKQIQSINVIKDATATYKYGEKGKNGVVEIKLKKVKQGDPITIQETDNKTIAGTGRKSKPGPGTADTSLREVVVFGYKRDKISSNTNEPVFEKAQFAPSVDKDIWRSFLEKSTMQIVEQIGNAAPTGTYTVNVSFIIEKDGSISNVHLLNDPGYGIGSKVLAMMKNAPNWKPAIQNQKVVRSTHVQPITFVIADT